MTERGRGLLDGNRWFTVALICELTELGVPIGSIMVDQESGGDEMDCLAVLSGDMVLFELKDKAFNLGNAYSFGAKIGIMRPNVAVIVTTEAVGNDARDHFERARAAGGDRDRRRYVGEEEEAAAPIYIEGIENLRPALEELMTRVTLDDATRVLSDVLPMASVSPIALLRRWVP